jgi:hypothetical protein
MRGRTSRVALVVAVLALMAASFASASGPITGKIRGTFHRDCLLCDGDLKPYIKTTNVWCAWQDGKVLIHVTMRNKAVEHVTVNWHPSYKIAGGGAHGEGLTSVQSSGFDPGELRQLTIKQDPKGVPDNSRISVCKPSFSTIESG